MCSVCFGEEQCANKQKEPFNSEHECEVPDGVRKVKPKEVPSITDLMRNEARKRAMRNECNSVWKRNADVEVPACGICAKPVSLDMILKTQSGTRICEECHYKLYHEEPSKPLQSDIEERYDAIPQEALRAIARVMGHGTRKYGPNNWDKIGFEDHVNHALRHINYAMLGDVEDENGTKAHLSHAITRLMFAYETYKEASE